MTFHPHKQSKFSRVDVNHPSFPWKNGRPDWPRYLAEKAEERFENNRRMGKKYKLIEFSRERCQYVDMKVCGAKVNGMLEMISNGRPVLVPVCDKHLKQLQALPNNHG
jgi:hypothetical protein